MQPVTVAVIGASTNPVKFGHRATRAYKAAGYEVYPIHPTAHEVAGVRAYPSLDAVPIERLDRVSVYVPPEVALGLLDQVARKQVGELWLNPGADDPKVVTRAEALGLNVVQACSLVALAGESRARR
jgi:predicted CoA-binding protein